MTVNEMERDAILKSFIAELPQLRKRVGLSQTELGEKVGLSRQTISAIERECTPLSWSIFLAIILVFLTNESGVISELKNHEMFDKVVESLKTDS